jgi:hypothetical protein
MISLLSWKQLMGPWNSRLAEIKLGDKLIALYQGTTLQASKSLFFEGYGLQPVHKTIENRYGFSR